MMLVILAYVLIKASLLDADENEVQFAITPPDQAELEAGDNMPFKVRLVDPSDMARRVSVTFIRAENMEHDTETEEPEKPTN